MPTRREALVPKKALLMLLTCLVCGLLASPAQASFHLMKIREVFPGSLMGGGDEYIVLQATARGQNRLTDHRVSFFHADGTESAGCEFSSNPSGAANQQFYLVAQPNVETTFGLARDCPFAAGGDPLQAAGGAVCWDETLVDCMAYGAFTNTLGLPVGHRASAPPADMSLTRTITRGCATALDGADDTNNSAADFSATTPNPRNSASPITETPCDAPNTKIKKRPKNRSHDDSPRFKFRSDKRNSTFKCKLDRKPFRKCHSPKTYHHVRPGKHVFKVKAIDANGNVDPTPAKDTFRVLQ